MAISLNWLDYQAQEATLVAWRKYKVPLTAIRKIYPSYLPLAVHPRKPPTHLPARRLRHPFLPLPEVALLR